ncbi:hypothetical protein GCM10011410_01660 [Hoyosella rhizosphaerae]|uniref:Uncharacterized protein n=1 Tax=Hoyosella rhizosphaerae TaxID=1755582 RepID=A0A916TZG7_9ACTN|nr:hypothetical protein GCM10011410_01660 [Hoyosella rhizosphaerae]
MNATLAEDDGTVAVGRGEAEVMHHHHDGAPRIGPSSRDPHHVLLVTKVQRGSWFIKQQDACVLRECHAGALSARRRCERSVSEPLDIAQFHRLGNRDGVIDFVRGAQPRRASHLNDFAGCERKPDGVLLGEHCPQLCGPFRRNLMER